MGRTAWTEVGRVDFVGDFVRAWLPEPSEGGFGQSCGHAGPEAIDPWASS